ncbi:MAG: hypothetical protein QXJ52_01870 [Candidatus Korarchaeota archaeon]|nr:hypothetical protein [Thermoproteota archaeon]
MSLSFIDHVRYAEENEAQELIEDFIRKNEGNVEKVKSMLISLLRSPERKVRRATLMAIKNTKFSEVDLIHKCATLTREDPENSIRAAAYETVMHILQNASADTKRELAIAVLKLISEGKATIDVTDIVKSIGENFAKELLRDTTLDEEIRDVIKYALEYLEQK